MIGSAVYGQIKLLIHLPSQVRGESSGGGGLMVAFQLEHSGCTSLNATTLFLYLYMQVIRWYQRCFHLRASF